MWDKPIAKYWTRVLKIASAGLSAYYSILACNTYAVSCLEYLCQLFWVPKRLLKLEARAIAITLKIPYYAYGKHGPFQLKGFGILSIRSVLAINCSAMFRASKVTLKGAQGRARRKARRTTEIPPDYGSFLIARFVQFNA
jgi:hypothetical protein